MRKETDISQEKIKPTFEANARASALNVSAAILASAPKPDSAPRFTGPRFGH